MGEGGSIIDLVSQLENCSIGEAITKLERQYGNTQSDPFSFHRDNMTASKTDVREEVIHIVKIMPITHSSLLEYLKERCIDTDIANRHCKEVYYRVNNKSYFALGFKNDSGGYELRNKYFKGCTNKDVTFYTCIDNKSDTCVIFEGFFDYLSYLTMKN